MKHPGQDLTPERPVAITLINNNLVFIGLHIENRGTVDPLYLLTNKESD